MTYISCSVAYRDTAGKTALSLAFHAGPIPQLDMETHTVLRLQVQARPTVRQPNLFLDMETGYTMQTKALVFYIFHLRLYSSNWK